MLWISEVEMACLLDELEGSRSIEGQDLRNFVMLDARTASVLDKIIQNSQSVWRNRKLRKTIGSFVEDRCPIIKSWRRW